MNKVQMIEHVRSEIAYLKVFFEKQLGTCRDNLVAYIDGRFNKIYESLSDKTRMERAINGLRETIDEQNKIIKALVTKEFQDCDTLDTVFIKPYRGTPYLIQNGKVIDTTHATNLTILCDSSGVRIETETV